MWYPDEAIFKVKALMKGEEDTQLESEAQLYSEYSIDLKIMQVKWIPRTEL